MTFADDAMFPAFAQELDHLMKRLDRATLVVSPFEAWVLLSQLQLALRHPLNTGLSARVARRLADRFTEIAAPANAPTLVEIARRGWQPEYDVHQEHSPLQIAAIAVVLAWEQLGRCEEEFLPGYPEACSEHRDLLDIKITVLQSELRAAGVLPPAEPLPPLHLPKEPPDGG